MVWGLLAASSLIETDALRLPAAEGENVTETVQEAPTGNATGLEGQVLVCEKSDAFGPASAMLLIDSGAVPEFVNVAVFIALVVPTSCEAKLRLVGVRAAVGIEPVPPSDND
jgi:hypothetical protein